MEDSQEKDYSFLGNDTFPNPYDALGYERKFKSEYLERQIYERLLKSEPPIVKFIENQSEHLSKLTLYHLANVLQGDLEVLMNRAEFIIFMQSPVPLAPRKFHVVVLVIYNFIIPDFPNPNIHYSASTSEFLMTFYREREHPRGFEFSFLALTPHL